MSTKTMIPNRLKEAKQNSSDLEINLPAEIQENEAHLVHIVTVQGKQVSEMKIKKTVKHVKYQPKAWGKVKKQLKSLGISTYFIIHMPETATEKAEKDVEGTDVERSEALQALKDEATKLGVTYRENIKLETLQGKVEAKKAELEAAGDGPDEALVALREEATELGVEFTEETTFEALTLLVDEAAE